MNNYGSSLRLACLFFIGLTCDVGSTGSIIHAKYWLLSRKKWKIAEKNTIFNFKHCFNTEKLFKKCKKDAGVNNVIIVEFMAFITGVASVLFKMINVLNFWVLFLLFKTTFVTLYDLCMHNSLFGRFCNALFSKLLTYFRLNEHHYQLA